ncbi:hypothetical protein EJ08DRAFT_206377 [Tothia fuscella]|uniref:Uncharacterized protein n=1 Tax=Tothia fuscella TaxID=1048955 RepID=A0A9P4TYS4_9PEZI|nr:hypothetical protein EJ08DRAFT_206377 [Tothia fuscella]
MISWKQNLNITGFEKKAPDLSLSRSSTLVAPEEEESHDKFHSAFLNKFGPNHKLLISDLENVPLGTPCDEKKVDGAVTANGYVSRLFVNGWVWEFLSWIVSALCVSGMAFVLGLYNDKRVPIKWPLGITLNAYISVLSAISKYALAVPVDEALGQLRWLYFSDRPRNLIDFELFDDASRGPWGSLALIIHTKAKSLVSLGASITLLSLALDPFYQQLVTYPQRPSDLDRSTVSRIVKYSTDDSLFVNSSNAIYFGSDSAIGSVMRSFYAYPSLFQVPEMAPFCASNDCAWPPFNTLSVCSQCEDISSLLHFDCLPDDGYWRFNWNMSIPAVPTTSCGYFFNSTGPKPMLMSGYAINSSTNAPGEALVTRQLNFRDPRTEEVYWEHSINFKNVPNAIVNFASVSVANAEAAYRNQTPVAHECVLRFCTQKIAARYYKGNYTENILSTFTNHTQRPWPIIMDGDASYNYVQNITIIPPDQDEIFSVDNKTMLQAIFAFDYKLPFYVTQQNTSALPLIRTENDRNDSRLTFLYSVDYWSTRNISNYVADLATAMAHAIRLHPTSSEKVLGSGSLEVYVHISWGWFTLPAMLLIGTLLFLVITMVQSRRQGASVFKTSAVATLANGLDDSTKQRVGSDSLSELFDKACTTKVMLQREMSTIKLRDMNSR